MLKAIASTGKDGEDGFTELIATLVRLQQVLSVTSRKEPAPITSAVQPTSAVTDEGRAKKKRFEPQAGKLGAILVERQRIRPDDLIRALKAQEAGDSREQERSKASGQDSTIRVHVTLLDRLMNLVGELVLARNQNYATGSSPGRHHISDDNSATEPCYQRTARSGDEDSHAAHQPLVRQGSSRGARRECRLR